MSTHTAHLSLTETPEEQLIIHCPACQKSVLAPASILGELVECPFCQHQFIIARPEASSGRDPETLKAELVGMEGQLRENVTQITELRGHVSRLNMELHRHQLRMKTLTERQAELQAGIAAAKTELGLAG